VKVLVSWSGGKDSALALHEIQKTGGHEITALLTTVTEEYDRTSMHGVRRSLLERQADSLGFSLEEVFIRKNTTDEGYESRMREVLEKYVAAGVSAVVFGDVFLEDVRKRREDKLSEIGLPGIFPLWGRDTRELAYTFIGLGFKAVTTCVDSNVLGKSFVGRVFDEQFISDLPSTVDPSGENGEFHSFVYAGPIFRHEVTYRRGDVVCRDKRFYYCDLLPA
jgi:uncharacterized protein (TIGR00290 family)